MRNFTTIQSNFYFSILVVGLSSCYGDMYPNEVPLERQQQNIYYAAKTPDVSLLKAKNDFSFSILYGGGDYHNGTDIQASYSPANHLGILANYNGYNNDGDITAFSGGDLGVGYYASLAPAVNFETYGGIGINHINNKHYTGRSKFNYTNMFLQPAFIFHTKDNSFQWVLISKFNLVNFNLKYASFDNSRESYSASQVRLLQDNPSQLFWEPGLVMRTGGKKLFFHVGYSQARDLTSSQLNYSKYHFSLGLHVRLPYEKPNQH